MCSLTENELEPVMEPADRLGGAEGQQLTCKKCRVNKSVVKLRLALSGGGGGTTSLLARQAFCVAVTGSVAAPRTI